MEKFPEADQLIQPLDTGAKNSYLAEASLRPATATTKLHPRPIKGHAAHSGNRRFAHYIKPRTPRLKGKGCDHTASTPKSSTPCSTRRQSLQQ